MLPLQTNKRANKVSVTLAGVTPRQPSLVGLNDAGTQNKARQATPPPLKSALGEGGYEKKKLVRAADDPESHDPRPSFRHGTPFQKTAAAPFEIFHPTSSDPFRGFVRKMLVCPLPDSIDLRRPTEAFP